MDAAEVIGLIKEKDIKFVDFRFTDTKGKEHHVTVPARVVDEGLFEEGKMFDGSSLSGWKGINQSSIQAHESEAVNFNGPHRVLGIFHRAWLGSKICPIVHPGQRILRSRGASRPPWRQSNDTVLHDSIALHYSQLIRALNIQRF